MVGDPTPFKITLEESGRTLSGLSGCLLDLGRVHESQICMTIHDALVRHTPPKRVTVADGATARRDLEGGTDGRFSVTTRYAVYLWLPEIYDESKQAVGTDLLKALRAYWSDRDVSVLVDLGVEDELDGFVAIFYPDLEDLYLVLSKTGQFASGVWHKPDTLARGTCEIGIVHL